MKGIEIWNRTLEIFDERHNDIVDTLTRRVDMTDMGIAFPQRVNLPILRRQPPVGPAGRRRMRAVMGLNSS